MRCRVVCVSGPVGARMHAVAQAVADRLGFALVNEAIVARAASDAGVDPQVVADLEKRQSLLDRILNAFASGSDANALVFSGGGYIAPDGIALSDELRDLIRHAIEETADRGDAVIVGHAAAYALPLRTDVLRVLITAPRETRYTRVAATQHLSEKDARKLVDDSDAGRTDYVRRLYDTRQELPAHYDLVVNTDRLSVDDAVELVLLAAS